MDDVDGVASASAAPANGPYPASADAFSAQRTQANWQQAVAEAQLGLSDKGKTSRPANTTSPATAFAGVAAAPAFNDATVFAPAASNSASLGDLAGGLPRSTLGAAGGGFLTGMFASMPHSPAPQTGAIAGPKLTYTYNPDEGTLTLQPPGADGQPSQTLATLHMGLNGTFTAETGQSVAALNPDGSLQFDRNYLGSLTKTPPAPPKIETFSLSPDAGKPLIETFPVSPDAGKPLIETFPVTPDGGKSLIEIFPADQNSGPTILEARPQPPVSELPAPAGSPVGTQTYQVGQNSITLTPQPGGTYKADFVIKEDFGDVVRSSATKQAGADARAKGEDGDVGFHTIAHRFFPGLTETVVPGNGQLNNSAYRAMENGIAAQLKDGLTVEGSIQPIPDSASRPSELRVSYTAKAATGEVEDAFAQRFPNTSGR
jgi:hypothetical protein